MKHVARPVVSLAMILVCTGATMAVGTVLKAPCANGSWSDGRQYRYLCYSDVVPLLGTEQLTGNRLPFINGCVKVQGRTATSTRYSRCTSCARRPGSRVRTTAPSTT